MQYIVMESNTSDREEFYEYIHSKYILDDLAFDKEYMIKSHFPFVIDFTKKYFTVLESITCCACAAQNKKIISIEEFKEKTKFRHF